MASCGHASLEGLCVRSFWGGNSILGAGKATAPAEVGAGFVQTGAVMLPKKVQEPAVPNLPGSRHTPGCTCAVFCHSHGVREMLVLHEPQQ